MRTESMPDQCCGKQVARRQGVASESVYVDDSSPEIEGEVAIVGKEERMRNTAEDRSALLSCGQEEAAQVYVKLRMHQHMTPVVRTVRITRLQ